MKYFSVTVFVAAAAVFVLAWLCTLGMGWLGRRNGWVSKPRASRWHTKAVALHGGVGFCLPFFLASGTFLYFQYRTAWLDIFTGMPVPEPARLGLALLVGAVTMFGCGLWDDIKELSPVTKILWQLAATSLFVYLNGVFPLTQWPVANLMLTYFWFVGITNAVNMLDNMDGLCAGVAMLSALSVAALVSRGGWGAIPAGPMGLFLASALLGYWIHNAPPAKIFMGDSGSMALGFSLAALAMPSAINGNLCLVTSGPVTDLMVFLVPTLVLTVPVFDTTFVTVTRLLQARKVHQGGCDHTSHRLVRLGFSERQMLLVLYGLAATGGGIALLAQYFPRQAGPILGIFFLLLVCFGAYLWSVSLAAEPVQEKLPLWIELAKSILLKRNVAMVVLDTVLIVCCFWGSYLLRFDFNMEPFLATAMFKALPVVVSCCLVGLKLAGAYGATWRLASVSDMPAYAVGSFIGVSLSVTVSTLVTRFGLGYSRSAYITFGFLLFLAVTMSRQSFRLLDTMIKRRSVSTKKRSLIQVIVYGAGKGGMILFEEALFNAELADYGIIGFVDDDPKLYGHKVCGLPVRSKHLWRRLLPRAPEIWASSKAVSDEKVLDFASLWSPAATVRRQTICLEPLLVKASESRPDTPSCLVQGTTSGASSDVDMPRHSVMARSGTDPLPRP